MRSFLTASLILTASISLAQTKPDSTRKLDEVVIKPYFSSQPLLRATGSIGVLNQEALNKQPSTSFVGAINTISGVRMEERSPGSYRLSIRGSLLRSPFGVRNVKIYLDDFPLTDAGGNTYLNALDVAGTAQIQILKGPHGNIFGANSGGVVLINPKEPTIDSTSVGLKTEAGSFGSFREDANLQHQSRNYGLSITQAYQQSDGYRDHSAMDRKYFQILQNIGYASNASLKSLIFYSDLHYNTPGGLTAAQYDLNPEASRPAAGTSKSAIEQQAGIYSKTLYGGVSHDWQIGKHFRHVLAAFTSYTNFKNPFISNYEKRDEFTLGLRSYLEYVQKSRAANWKFNLGLESTQTSTNFDNYNNDKGKYTTNQASDDLTAASNFAFVHLSADFFDRLLIELSASANLYQYGYRSIAPMAIPYKTNKFDLQLMPRAAVSYLIGKQLSLRASLSKGYSPPTLSEVRASDNVINIDLKPEHGWNYEAGFRIQSQNNRVFFDLTGFSYQLKNAIVRRLNENNTEYFINAGGTKQLGVESSLSISLIPSKASGMLRGLQLGTAYTLSHFRFRDYLNVTDDFSGNELTGVPKTTLVSNIDLELPKKFYLFLQHNYTSSIPLNDANSMYAKAYHVLQAKIGLRALRIGKANIAVFAAADNLLNQKYSLGNDLNAFGGRYFNAAPVRNYYAGLEVKL
ncbi:TonB-dependent receptor [Pedobacter frigoris]|uniref:TonB-dependent receptor n=1 Tax=Pedobacter frigoris TaxID=2571272 RepID=A0A4U1CK01_9SPHI|nr:TonB-dependent receptor [Pedobacter frigoris]TKC07152.1 TonB-dependent receptor [Pedobacter frigoris]